MLAINEHSPITISLFEDCTNDDVKEIERRKRLLNFDAGEYIIQESEPANGVFCLLTGGVKIVKRDFQGDEKIVSLAKEGYIIGLRSVIDRTNYTTSTVAIVKSSCCFIPGEYILQIIDKYPSISMKIITSLCKEISEVEEKIASIARKNVVERVAEILLILLRYYGTDQNNFLRITLSWKDLADMSNITQNTLSRVLNELKQSGMIAIQNKKIQLSNVNLLEKIAN